MAKQEEEPVMGIPYPAVYHPNQNLYQAGVISPNAFQTIFRDTLAPFNCVYCGSSGVNSVKFRFDDTQIAWNLLACPVTSANM
ncbi:hypothetical protein PVL29_002761 [Vitis rotundifolia]|uniref:Uncharacterized protein n=1 Tax=Vitis rotundifolia TaxID=103349 RepID=A0AA39DZX1_VITRO|nr:hypothetical protein PVL29_002761 [Vitis rotundifolia]